MTQNWTADEIRSITAPTFLVVGDREVIPTGDYLLVVWAVTADRDSVQVRWVTHVRSSGMAGTPLPVFDSSRVLPERSSPLPLCRGARTWNSAVEGP